MGGVILKVLLVSPFLPHAAVSHAGGKFVQMVAEFLAGRHDLSVVARVFPGEEVAVEEARSRVRRLFAVRADTSASPVDGTVGGRIASYYMLAREAERAVRENAFDVVLVEYTETGLFLSTRGWPPAVLDCHDIITKPWLRRWTNARGMSTRLGLWAAFQALSQAERRVLRKFRSVFVRSPIDAGWARAWFGHPDIRVLPHPAGEGFSTEGHAEIPGRILFLGAMGRPLNVDAALFFHERVFPFVRAKHPEAEFWIVGADPPARLSNLTARDPSVRVTGYVDDIGEHYRSAAVFVAPMLVGGGIIVKILDAMACGVPVVTTAYGNEGIGAGDGEEIFVADAPGDFAARVVALLDDPALRRRVGENAARFAHRNFDREKIMGDLERALGDILAHGNVISGGSGQA